MSVLNKIDKKLKEDLGAGRRVEYVCKGPHKEACDRGNKKKKTVTEQIDFMIANPTLKLVSDEAVFAEMANLLMTLEPDQLTNEQIDDMLDIIEKMRTEAEVEEEIKAKKSSFRAKKYAQKYYSDNKKKIKAKKKQLEKSTQGYIRAKMTPYNAKKDQTPTGRKRRSYNV